MGFLKNLMKTDKQQSEDEDPDWAELKKFREAQKKGVSGETGSSDSGSDSVSSNDTSSKSATEDPSLPLTTDSQPSHEYLCTQCGLKLKESWNRCPKCGGNIEPVGLDTPEDIKEKYPDPYPGKPAPGLEKTEPAVPAPPTPASAKKVKKIRKVRKPGKPQSPNLQRKQNKGVPRSQERELHPPTKRNRVRSPQEQDLDDLFTDDPILDSRNIAPREHEPRPRQKPKGSWKDVPPLMDHSTLSVHTPPPEVKSMLDNLMDSGVKKGGAGPQVNCPKCGFKNPPGSWDFCMSCGHPF